MKKTLAILMSTMLVLPGTIYAATKPAGTTGKPAQTVQKNQPKWSLSWSDEFNGKNLDRKKWTYDTGNWMTDKDGKPIVAGWGNNEKEYYTNSKENSFIKDGKLIIQAKKKQTKDQFGTYEYTSAKLKTKGLFSQTYGRYEIRAKLPTGKGLWPALWMLPENDKYGAWAASGEIDMVEGWGSKPQTIAGTLHYGEGWPNDKYTGKEFLLPKNNGVDHWHTYALEWEPGEFRFYVDGKLYQTQNKWYSKGKDNATKYSYPAPFDQNFYLIMNLAVGGNFDGDPDAATKFPKQMEVDYVRVYKAKNYRTPVEPKIGPVSLPANAKKPLADGNLIYDQNYTKPITNVDQASKPLDPINWNFVHLPDFGGAGSTSVEAVNGRNFAKIDITNPGSQLYSVQLIQNVSLGQGGKYKVSFDAKSTAPRNMMVKTGAGASRGWVKYSNEETIKLTDKVQSYEFTFDLLNPTDIAARLEFNLGGNGTNPVWIGNVKVQDITGIKEDPNAAKQPLPNGNHVYNGTFDQGSMDRMTYWNFSQKKAVSTASVSASTRELHVAIKNGGKTADAILLNQKGMYLLKGNDYKLTFKVRSNKPRTISVGVVNADGSKNYSGTKTIKISTKMETKTITFTMPNTVTDAKGMLVFSFGGSNNDVYLDDVVLLKTSDKPDYGNIDLYPLKNGEFSNGLDAWSNYIHFDAAAQITAENGEAKVAIANEGNETWSVLFKQDNLNLAKGVVYELSFSARSTKEREAEVSVENAQYTRFLSQTVSLNAQMKKYSFEFKMPADDITSFKMLLGKNQKSPLGSHDVFVDNVVLKVKDAPAPTPVPTPTPVPGSTPGVDNGNFSNGTESWTAWWGDQWSGVAEGSMSNADGELKVNVTKVGGASYAPQVFQKDLSFEKGGSYTVEFDARADVPRKINVNVGKELTADPWFTPYVSAQTLDLAPTMKHYSFTFTMNEESYKDGKIVFELGNIANGNAPTTVYFDNVSVKKN